MWVASSSALNKFFLSRWQTFAHTEERLLSSDSVQREWVPALFFFYGSPKVEEFSAKFNSFFFPTRRTLSLQRSRMRNNRPALSSRFFTINLSYKISLVTDWTDFVCISSTLVSQKSNWAEGRERAKRIDEKNACETTLNSSDYGSRKLERSMHFWFWFFISARVVGCVLCWESSLGCSICSVVRRGRKRRVPGSRRGRGHFAALLLTVFISGWKV